MFGHLSLYTVVTCENAIVPDHMVPPGAASLGLSGCAWFLLSSGKSGNPQSRRLALIMSCEFLSWHPSPSGHFQGIVYKSSASCICRHLSPQLSSFEFFSPIVLVVLKIKSREEIAHRRLLISSLPWASSEEWMH